MKITEQDKRDIALTRTLLASVSEYLCMLWDRELKFNDNGEPNYEGLDEEDREIAEDKFAQINAVDVAEKWLYKILNNNK